MHPFKNFKCIQHAKLTSFLARRIERSAMRPSKKSKAFLVPALVRSIFLFTPFLSVCLAAPRGLARCDLLGLYRWHGPSGPAKCTAAVPSAEEHPWCCPMVGKSRTRARAEACGRAVRMPKSRISKYEIEKQETETGNRNKVRLRSQSINNKSTARE